MYKLPVSYNNIDDNFTLLHTAMCLLIYNNFQHANKGETFPHSNEYHTGIGSLSGTTFTIPTYNAS